MSGASIGSRMFILYFWTTVLRLLFAVSGIVVIFSITYGKYPGSFELFDLMIVIYSCKCSQASNNGFNTDLCKTIHLAVAICNDAFMSVQPQPI
ncbi:hypothetical protein BDV93DRAFT_338032 [Ceratobasidium sp. AG-I]|nr:hypothetical protein BDV93DRAFT_338032 [Ceratobasidium sp. AG-I]